MKKTFTKNFGKERTETTIEEVFDYKGFKCVVTLNELHFPEGIKISKKMEKLMVSFERKWRCGYVGVPSQHPLYKKTIKHEIDELVFAHGGLTFSDFGDEKILPKNAWWFGFDCHHSNDTIHNWTFKRVKKEVMELAEQLTTKNLILRGLEDD